MKRLLSLIIVLALATGVFACSADTSDLRGSKKLAVLFPGMGYTTDRPLLSESRKLLEKEGYEILCIEWENPVKTRYDQASEILDSINFNEYEDVIFVCKSIGTEIASTYVAKHDLDVKQIWYTPLMGAFEACDSDDCGDTIIAFIGTSDGRSDVSQIREKAARMNIELHLYDGCDHSLECKDASKNREILDDIMKITRDYVIKDIHEA